jgi:hypothetical protein
MCDLTIKLALNTIAYSQLCQKLQLFATFYECWMPKPSMAQSKLCVEHLALLFAPFAFNLFGVCWICKYEV